MSFFQPEDATANRTGSATPSPAAQAMAKYRLQILMALLNASSNRRPGFAAFTRGAPLPQGLPAGLGNLGAGALDAMNQPGAFTSTATGTETSRGQTPSTLSDIIQMALVGAKLFDAFGSEQTRQDGILKTVNNWFSNSGSAPGAATSPTFGGSDQLGFTPEDPNAQLGFTSADGSSAPGAWDSVVNWLGGA